MAVFKLPMLLLKLWVALGNGAPLPMTMPTQLIEHGEVKLVPLPLYTSVHGTGRHSACYQKGTVNIYPATHSSIYNDVLTVNCARAVVSQSL